MKYFVEFLKECPVREGYVGYGGSFGIVEFDGRMTLEHVIEGAYICRKDADGFIVHRSDRIRSLGKETRVAQYRKDNSKELLDLFLLSNE